MRTLHVAALPFPSPQGTQALVHAMLQALADRGHDTHLLSYGHGAGALEAHYTVHRARSGRSADSLRSGPSLEKLGLDLDLARRLRALERALVPDLVVAHHVEAAASALTVCRGPVLFVAHTSLRTELPTYFSPRFSRMLAAFGAVIDRALVRRASAVRTVSPLLATLLEQGSERALEALPLPWTCPEPTCTREEARRALGLDAEQEVALYAGNLDPYQGLEAWLPELAARARARPRFRVLIASESPLAPWRARAHELHDCLVFTRLACEADRARVHAAADVALVPRRAAGGVPIKLLDACARGVPVIAARRALAGFAFPGCEVLEHPRELAQALERVFAALPEARARAARARRYVAREHDPSRFVSALEQLATRHTPTL